MDINEFYEPRGDVFKFDVLGDAAEGVITAEPDLGADKFNPDRKMLTIRLGTEDGDRALFARNAMLDAIAEAVRAAGATSIEAGGYLSVIYTEDRLLRSGRSMKRYNADYTPPAPMGDALLGETAPWDGPVA